LFLCKPLVDNTHQAYGRALGGHVLGGHASVLECGAGAIINQSSFVLVYLFCFTEMIASPWTAAELRLAPILLHCMLRKLQVPKLHLMATGLHRVHVSDWEIRRYIVNSRKMTLSNPG
jgi:hypothetical protein